MSGDIYLALQATSEDIGKARRAFSRDKSKYRRDMLLCSMSYGIQMCLRAQSMHFAASAIEARRAETPSGSVVDESAVVSEASETPTPSPAQPGDA